MAKILYGTDDFNFLNNGNVEAFLKNSKCMFVMRGLPGSGKTTLARLIANKYTSAVICSADDHFLHDDGTYRRVNSELGTAHKLCQDKVRQSCMNSVGTIIIDNTNVRQWEMRPYFDMANMYGYFVFLIEPKTPWRNDVHALSINNKHGVNLQLLLQKQKSYETIIPKYYSWMLNMDGTNSLLHLGQNVLANILTIDDACKAINEFFPSGVDLKKYHTRQHFISSVHILHCTAMFNHKEGPCSSTERSLKYYAANQSILGSIFHLQVTGFIITPQTFSARVKLNDSQLKLFVSDEDPVQECCAGIDDFLARRMAHLNVNQKSNNLPRGSRAHITLGCKPGIEAVAAGNELIELSRMEDRPILQKENGDIVLSYYGFGNFLVTLKKSINFETIFTGTFI